MAEGEFPKVDGNILYGSESNVMFFSGMKGSLVSDSENEFNKEFNKSVFKQSSTYTLTNIFKNEDYYMSTSSTYYDFKTGTISMEETYSDNITTTPSSVLYVSQDDATYFDFIDKCNDSSVSGTYWSGSWSENTNSIWVQSTGTGSQVTNRGWYIGNDLKTEAVHLFFTAYWDNTAVTGNGAAMHLTDGDLGSSDDTLILTPSGGTRYDCHVISDGAGIVKVSTDNGQNWTIYDVSAFTDEAFIQIKTSLASSGVTQKGNIGFIVSKKTSSIASTIQKQLSFNGGSNYNNVTTLSISSISNSGTSLKHKVVLTVDTNEFVMLKGNYGFIIK